MIGACALLGVLSYIPTLTYQLVWDDVDIIVHNGSSPFQAFGHSFWHGGSTGFLGKDPYYRPLVNFSLGIDEAVAGHRAWYFHLVNLLLHGAVVALVGVAVWQVCGSLWLVFAAGLLFAVHPMFADSVAYVSGRTDLLAGAGLLVALLGLLRLQKRHDWPAAAMLWVGFAIGVLSKETAVLLVVVAPVWLLGLSGWRRPHPRDVVALAGLGVLLAGYLAARYAVLGSVVGMSMTGGAAQGLALSASSFGRSLVSFILPFSGRAFAWDAGTMGRLNPWLLPAFLYVALPFAAKPMWRSREAGLGWLWGLVMLAPVAALSGFGPQGRLLYLPAVGFAILLARVGAGLKPGTQRAAAVAVLAACVVMVPFTLRRMSVWKDGFTLFSRMTREAPGYATGHFNLAAELRQRGNVDGAITEYRKTIEMDPSLALAYSNLGALLQSKGELAEAESLYRRTIEMRPKYALAWNNLAVVLYKRGDVAGAAAAFKQAMELNPDDAGAAYNLGRLYQNAGKLDSAAAMFERAFRLQPGNSQIRASYEQTMGKRPDRDSGP